MLYYNKYDKMSIDRIGYEIVKFRRFMVRAKRFLSNPRNLVVPGIILYAMIMTIACVIFTGKFTVTAFKLQEAVERIVVLDSQVENYEVNLKEANETIAKMSDSIDGLVSVSKEMETQSVEYKTRYTETKKKLEDLQAREELFNKYEYVVLDPKTKERTDVTYEQLKTTEELCKEKGVDSDFIFSIVMVESRGHENAKNSSSTATGFGQFLRGTGKYTFETLMGNGVGTYNHSMALDGDLNLNMMVYYIESLKKGSSSYNEIMNKYAGKDDPGYKAKLNSYLAYNDKSLSNIKME